MVSMIHKVFFIHREKIHLTYLISRGVNVESMDTEGAENSCGRMVAIDSFPNEFWCVAPPTSLVILGVASCCVVGVECLVPILSHSSVVSGQDF